jgi:glutamyl-tRNA reductase
MPIVVVGLNHRTAPVTLLERLAVGEEDLPKALHQLSTFEHVIEGAILSTCNRVEVYALVSKFHGGAQDLRNFMSEFRHVAPEDFADHLYTYHDEAAVRHLFRVSCGIDSMVVGETEILGQVRRAYQVAQEEGTVQRVLGGAFRQALSAGKRARTETEIARNPVSISSAAVELAKRAFAGRTLEGMRVVIVGAGKMGRLAAQALAQWGATDVTVVNRSQVKAQALAASFNAVPRPFDDLEPAIAGADIVLCSTTAPGTVIDRPMAQRALGPQRGRPLFIVDIAVPRDVEPSVGDLEDVILRDIDDLKGVVESNRESRLGEVSRVEEIISGELDRFDAWQHSTEIAPTIGALVERADVLRREEIKKLQRHLATMTPEQRDAVDHLTRRLVAKLLHDPITKARELSASAEAHTYLNALRELLELDDEPDP